MLNINVPFYEKMTHPDLIKLGACVDELLQFKESEHQQWMYELISKLGLYTAFIKFMGPGFCTTPFDLSEKMFDEFLLLPLTDMPLYFVDPPADIHERECHVLCPPPEEGPTYWQMILARWRLQIGK